MWIIISVEAQKVIGFNTFTLTHQPERYEEYHDAMHEEKIKMYNNMLNPIGFTERNNTDTMYYHEAMKADNEKNCCKAIVKELNTQIERKRWILIPKEKVPNVYQVPPEVWTFKQKRDIKKAL